MRKSEVVKFNSATAVLNLLIRVGKPKTHIQLIEIDRYPIAYNLMLLHINRRNMESGSRLCLNTYEPTMRQPLGFDGCLRESESLKISKHRQFFYSLA